MSFVSNLLDSFRYVSKIEALKDEKARVNHIMCELILLRIKYSDVLSQKSDKALLDARTNSIIAQDEINEMLDHAIQEIEQEYKQ